VLGQRHRRGRNQVGQAVIDHRPRPVAGLLGGLEQRDQRAGPVLPAPGEQVRRAGQAGHVHIVTAGVHHRHLGAVGVGAGLLARVGQPGRLAHRERVHVGAQEHDRAVAVGEHADDAGAAHRLVHLVAGPPEVLGDQTGRPVFLV
jgi:hypothetical protein